MIKLINILRETQILVPRRSPEERQKNYLIATQKKIQQYIKDGSQGDLDLVDAPIQSLPDNLKVVGGHLDLRGTNIKELPNGLKVGGDLWLIGTPIQSLPDNLTVGGDLSLTGTPIQSLPDNLKVGGHLSLSSTPIQSLPDNLTVGGFLNLINTPLSKKYTTEEQLKAKYPNIKVKGDIYLK